MKKIVVLMAAVLSLTACVGENRNVHPSRDGLDLLAGKTLAVVDASEMRLNYADAATSMGMSLGIMGFGIGAAIASEILTAQGARARAGIDTEFSEINEMPARLLHRVEEYVLSEFSMSKIDEKVRLDYHFVYSDELEDDDARYGNWITYHADADYVLTLKLDWQLHEFPKRFYFGAAIEILDARTQSVISSVQCIYNEKKDGSNRGHKVLRNNGGEILKSITNAIEDRCVKKAITNMSNPLG